jgi:LuxR family maltose regulon positive regulatory protein
MPSHVHGGQEAKAGTGRGSGSALTRERRVVRAVGFVPVEAKLRVPDEDDTLVPRGEIIDQLLDANETPVVLITAAPGYGKTVVTQQWALEDPRPFAWLTLDDTDNDPVVLLTYLMLALQRVEPVDAGILALLVEQSDAIREVALPRLGRMLRRRERPFVLVLDDADALTSPEAIAVVDTITHHLPPGSQLAVIGRRAPVLDWSSLRVRRQLFELTADDLRLPERQANALIESAGLQLSDWDVHRLVERTEGWAAGIYLAAASLSAAARERHAVEGAMGDDSIIAVYLRDHMLAGLSPADQAFLTRCSILGRMSGPLCDALLRTHGSEATLRRLCHANMLLVGIDREERWFRLHQLFADTLRAELMRREPDAVRRLHSRASAWFETDGDIESAIEHGIAAGEIGRAARLIWSRAGDLLAAGDVERLEHWLDLFTMRQVAAHAKLSLTAGWCALHRGRPVDHWINAAENGLYEADRTGEPESTAAATALLRAVLARNGLTQMAADARLAMRLQEPDDIWRCTAMFLDAEATYLTGHPAEARPRLREIGDLAEAYGAYPVLVAALTQLATLAVEVNDWRGAEELSERAVEVLTEHRLQDVPLLVGTHCMSALLAARSGRADEAAALARRCSTLIAITPYLPPWAAMQCRYLLARAQLILGDTAAARVLLSEAFASDTNDATSLRELTEKTWQQIEQMSLGFAHGASALTTAELRVLQYLPTYLSFENIGKELFVSRNTVKSQAIAAYRKLGVTSRTEAVERAQALGLVQK